MIVTLTPNPVLDHTLTVPRIEFDDVLARRFHPRRLGRQGL